MQYARISDGVVAEIWTSPDGDTSPEDAFHPSLAAAFVACGEEVAQGYIYDGGEFTEPVEPVPSQGDLLAYAANARWLKEVGGISVSGVPVATDDRSKQMILGARVAADADDNFATEWVGADGNIYPLTAQQVVGISNAVLVHVASCFQIFATVSAGIEDETITTAEEIDEAFA